LVINVFAAVGYQTYLALGFNVVSTVNSKIFKWNALIPFVFMSFYLLYVVFLTLIEQNYHNPRSYWGPLRKSQLHGTSLIIILFLIHAFITFYFLNNQFVSKKIKVEPDIAKRESLRLEFLVPMKRLVKISVWVIAVSLMLSTIIDIVNFSILAKN
jgi:hypothetical protein